jgi:hypothetical protein
VSEVRIARSSKGLKRLNPQQLKEFFRAGIAAGKIEAHAFRLVGESHCTKTGEFLCEHDAIRKGCNPTGQWAIGSSRAALPCVTRVAYHRTHQTHATTTASQMMKAWINDASRAPHFGAHGCHENP